MVSTGGPSGSTLALTLLFALAVPVATFVLLYNHLPGFLASRSRRRRHGGDDGGGDIGGGA